MTKYRSYHDGEMEWLQYLYEPKFLIFKWPFTKWKYVLSSEWNYYKERWASIGHVDDYYRYMTILFGSVPIGIERISIHDFIKKYPDIKLWNAHRRALITEKRNREYERRRIKGMEISEKIGTTLLN